MPIHGRRGVLLALLVALLASGVGVSPRAAVASSSADEGHGRETIITVLHPGWNLVGWVGSDTPTSELFATIPALRQVSAWDAEAQAYLDARRDKYDELSSLSRGMGIWLRIGGGSTVEWSRNAGPDAFAVRLHPGINLVAIAADGGVTSVSRVATAAYRWNSKAQRFAAYRFGDAELGRGDALWLEVGAAVNWWQTGTSDHAVVFLGDVPADTRAAILGQYERVKDFFVERFGIVTPGPLQYIAPDVELLRNVYVPELDFAFSSTGTYCHTSISSRVSKRVLACTYPNTSSGRDVFGPEFSLVPEFAENLRFHLPSAWRWLGSLPAVPMPHWLVGAAGLYAETAYAEASEPLDRRWRANALVDGRRVTVALSELETVETSGVIIPLSPEERRVAFFAIEHLLRIGGEPALFEYLRQLRQTADWRGTFATVFGIAVEDFYASFEAYRAEAFPPLPHLVDDLEEPVLVMLDGVPKQDGEAIREEFEAVRRFFASRFEATTEFTMFVAPNAESIQAELVRPYVPTDCWLAPSWGVVDLPLDLCTDAPGGFDYMYYLGVRDELSIHHVTSVPRWFNVGSQLYVRAAYADDTDRTSYIDYRNHAVSAAGRSREPLRTVTIVDSISFPGGALGFLAVEWLANHAGDPAIFDYYRRLPEATSRDEAFEGAFGLTLEKFYEQFEAYRATLGAP